MNKYSAIFWRYGSLYDFKYNTFEDALQFLVSGEQKGRLSSVGVVYDNTFYACNCSFEECSEVINKLYPSKTFVLVNYRDKFFELL